MYDFDSLKNVSYSSTIHEQILSEKVVYNIKQPEENGHASTSSCHTEMLTQLWESVPKKRVREEMKGGNRKKEKIIVWMTSN